MSFEFRNSFRSQSSWCRKRTNMERRLLIICLIIFLITMALLIALCVTIHKTSNDPEDETCTTPGCIHAASTVLKYIDESVNPCDNFYQFACGTYLKHTTIPEDKSSITPADSIKDTILDQLKAVIKEPLTSKSIKPYHLLKKLYTICMNTTAIDEDGLPTALQYFKDVGGWPLLEGYRWNENMFDWKQLVYKLRKMGKSSDYFVSVYITVDRKNSTRRVIHVDEASINLDREFLIKGFEEKLVKAYYDYMVDIAVLYGADRDLALEELRETLELEIKIAKISIPSEEYRNSSALYNPMKVKDLMVKYPFIPWVDYINNILDIPNIKITENEDIVVTVPAFLDKIQKILRNTPKRIQANYIMCHIALSVVPLLTEEFRNRELKYKGKLTGLSERPSRWKECTGVASGSLQLALGASYVRKYFKESAKRQAEEMVTDIKNRFIETLKSVTWMDEVTKQHALEKANSITHYIGYPDELLDEKKLEDYYSDLDFPSDSYIEAIQSLSLFTSNKSNKKLREPINKTEWINHAYPTIVNAFYLMTQNSIDFPAGILQGIFFDDNRPRYMNYGGIGYVVGHEITHGFDDLGRQYDKNGNLNEWWKEGTKMAFVKKAQCIIDQYSNSTVTGIDININGVTTQGENIADNGGIKEAYLAYQGWVERNSPELKLPGLKYSPNQMFWVSAAQTWCSKQRTELIKLRVTSDVHSPSEYRVVLPFGNSGYFAKDFDCPLGSKMNPVKKCSVW